MWPLVRGLFGEQVPEIVCPPVRRVEFGDPVARLEGLCAAAEVEERRCLCRVHPCAARVELECLLARHECVLVEAAAGKGECLVELRLYLEILRRVPPGGRGLFFRRPDLSSSSPLSFPARLFWGSSFSARSQDLRTSSYRFRL